MKKLFILPCLVAALAVACTTDDATDAAMADSQEYSNAVAEVSLFEGVWSLDDTPFGQKYELEHYVSGAVQRIVLRTFPYQQVLAQLLPNPDDISNAGTDQHPMLTLAPIGHSALATYSEVVDASDGAAEVFDSPKTEIPFRARLADGTVVEVSLELQASESTFVLSDMAASCILSVRRVVMTYPDGERTIRALNPARTLTFISAKKTREK